MKHFYLYFLLISAVSFPTFFSAQPLHLRIVYPPTQNTMLHSHFALSMPDNSALSFGYYQSRGMITKLDSAGHFKWAKTYLLNSNTNLLASFVDATNSHDSTFAAVATLENSTQYSAYCLKFKANGDTLWCRKIINNSLVSIIPHSINSTTDSGFVICGRAVSSSTVSGPSVHAFVAKITKAGNLSWIKTLSTSSYASDAYTIKQTSDSGFIFIGGVQNSSNVDWCTAISKLDKLGTLSWQKKYCTIGSLGNDDIGYDILEENNGYLCFLTGGTYNSYLLRTDITGNSLWVKKYSAQSNFSSINERPIHLRKINSKIRQVIFKGPNSGLGWSMLCDTLGFVQANFQTYYTDFDVVKLKNKNFMLVGNPDNYVFKSAFPSYGKFGIVVTDSTTTGYSPCYQNNGIGASTQTLTTTSFSSTLISAGTLSSTQATIGLLSFSDSTGCMAIPTGIAENQLENTSVYPNPTEGKLIISSEALKGKQVVFKLYNVTGKMVLSKEFSFEKNEEIIDLTKYEASVYFYNLHCENKTVKSGKIIIAK
ncbi:MAG: T9SS type A sorting domain-containing protein [Bacteroidia bacterium]